MTKFFILALIVINLNHATLVNDYGHIDFSKIGLLDPEVSREAAAGDLLTTPNFPQISSGSIIGDIILCNYII